MSDEHKFQDKFQKELRMYDAYVPSIVGGVFQSGQPDLSITTRYGYEFKCELKFWRKKHIPASFHEIIALLDGPQVGVIKHQLWRRGVYCPIVAQLYFDLDKVAIAYKDTLEFANWKDLAKSFAHFKQKPLPPTFAGLTEINSNG